jgi:hypothetical protein
LALEIVAERLKLIGVRCREMRYDLIGADAIHGAKLSAVDHAPQRFGKGDRQSGHLEDGALATKSMLCTPTALLVVAASLNPRARSRRCGPR